MTSFLRLTSIIGDQKKDIDPRIPVSKSTWWAGVKSGRFPPPVKLSPGVTVWRKSDIDALCEEIATTK
jgi:prophage regulatory protein